MAAHAELLATVERLTQRGKGILAADESVSTFGKRVRAAALGARSGLGRL
jgi:fructose-bisphosphate aldolase class 1